MHYRDLDIDEHRFARSLLEAMSADDQVHHFLHLVAAGDLDAWETRAQKHRLIGCFDQGELAGFAQVAVDDRQAECSLFVKAEDRHRGIGTELFYRACTLARGLGARTLTIVVTRGDAQMLDLAARMNGLSIFRHGESMIVPGADHPNARWLVFDLESIPTERRPAGHWFKSVINRISEHLER